MLFSVLAGFHGLLMERIASHILTKIKQKQSLSSCKGGVHHENQAMLFRTFAVYIKLERMGHGYWVTRTPDIHKDEWHAFVASCPDLRLPNRIFGEMPDGFESRPNLPEFVWLNVGTPSKILFSKGAIFIDASGQEAAQFALAAAEYFGATAQEA